MSRQLGIGPGDALIVTDAQQDFIPGGSLAVRTGDEVVAPLNAYIAAFAARRLPIFLTRDWHPEGHCSFTSSGGPGPPHCVQGTPGAQWASGLTVLPDARIISKGTRKSAEAYSSFSSTALLALLRDLDVRRIFIGGLTTDYCIHDTVLDARSHGFEVVVLADAIRGINAQPEDETRAIREILASGATMVQRPRARRSRAQVHRVDEAANG